MTCWLCNREGEGTARVSGKSEPTKWSGTIHNGNGRQKQISLSGRQKQSGTDLTFKVHMKSTHSDPYLQLDSSHARASKMTVVRALVDRAINVCSTENLNEGLSYVEGTLKKSSFPVRVISKYIRQKSNENPEKEHQRAANSITDNQTSSQSNSFAVLPYDEGLANICRLLKKE